MKRTLAVVLLLTQVAAVPIKPQGESFYVYQEGGSKLNHFCPSNWMGSFGDLHFNGLWKENPGQGASSIQIKYSAKRSQGDGWAGIYWAAVCNSWGDKGGTFDLSAFKKVTFMARGEKGNEVIDKFFMGGICGEKSCDAGAGQTDTIELTKKWKTYEIDLSKEDLTSVVGGFGFTLTADANPDGATFYIDEVKYIR